MYGVRVRTALFLLGLSLRMRFEIGGQVRLQRRGEAVCVFHVVKRNAAHDVEGVVFPNSAERGGPALGGFDQLWKLFADIAVATVVVVEIVVQFVDDLAELVQGVVHLVWEVGVTLSLGQQILNAPLAAVQDGGEYPDARHRLKGGITQIVDFALAEGILSLLRMSRSSRQKKQAGCQREGEQSHADLVRKDRGEEIIMHTADAAQYGLHGVTLLQCGDAHDVGQPVHGTSHQQLGIL